MSGFRRSHHLIFRLLMPATGERAVGRKQSWGWLEASPRLTPPVSRLLARRENGPLHSEGSSERRTVLATGNIGAQV